MEEVSLRRTKNGIKTVAPDQSRRSSAISERLATPWEADHEIARTFFTFF